MPFKNSISRYLVVDIWTGTIRTVERGRWYETKELFCGYISCSLFRLQSIFLVLLLSVLISLACKKSYTSSVICAIFVSLSFRVYSKVTFVNPGIRLSPFLFICEQRCTLLSNAAPFWATLHPFEQHCTLLSNAGSSWATLHPPDYRCKCMCDNGAQFLCVRNSLGGSLFNKDDQSCQAFCAIKWEKRGACFVLK